MKKTLLLAIATLFATVSFAQQQLATLNHNDSITVYYGINALQQAHSAAVNGDIITLSSGAFDPVTITKAVTIRGAGAWADSLGSQTTLRSSFTINVPNDSVYHLTLEGLYLLNSVTAQSAYNPQFIKCCFESYFYCNNASHTMRNAMFLNCDLMNWYNEVHPNFCAQGTQFVNSVIRESARHDSPDVFINCVLQQNPTQSSILSRMFQNCVLYYNYGSGSCPTQNSTTANNCLFVQLNTSTSTCANLFSGHPNHTLWNARGWSTVCTGYYELNDSIAANCLGPDGTQIGIYGGTMPFDPRVTNPIIKRINVAQRSTADGKLAVDIEVVSDEE